MAKTKDLLINTKMSIIAACFQTLFQGQKEGKYPELEKELPLCSRGDTKDSNSVNHKMLHKR